MAPFSACFLPLSWMLVCMGFFFCYTVKVYLPKTLVKIGCCHRYCIARKEFDLWACLPEIFNSVCLLKQKFSHFKT